MAVHYNRISIKFISLILVLVLVLIEYDLPLISAKETLGRYIEREREALLRFKHSLIHKHDVLSSWGSEDCCKWNGVGCNNSTGHVTALQLYGIKGKISPALLELHHLNHLDLGGNDFGGIRIPEFIGSIKTLEYLNLENCNFSGRIPPQLGNLTNLRILDLAYNGHIWSHNLYWLSGLPFLSHLYLNGANVSADTNWLQHVLLNHPFLQELDLSSCMLSDHVTKSSAAEALFVHNFSSASSLSLLDLSYNQFTSSAFDWLFNISSSVVTLLLSRNEFNGPIPDALGKLYFLEFLNLSDNMLRGGIPKSFRNLTHIQDLYLYGNDLGESLEKLLGKLSCTQIVSLRLSDTQLTGPVPATSLTQLSKIEELDLSFNSLQGTISEAHFINLHNLEKLDLSFNSLSLDLSPDWIPPFRLVDILLASCKMGPSFPTWLKTQNRFFELDLSSAGISDEVPKWFWDLSTHVLCINLSHNQMSGNIPDFSPTFNFNMSLIDVSYNKFSGPLPLLHPYTYVARMNQNQFSGSISSICRHSYPNLVLLDLSNNHLASALPTCWENMAPLYVLNLNNNNLYAQIPPSLGSLSNLKTLHLRGNNLSGELPSTLKNCRLLQSIDIGGNHLTGKIPLWLGQNHAKMMYLSFRQNRFYGNIPPEICKLTQIQMLDLSRNKLSGKIPQCFNNFTSLNQKNATTTSTIPIPIYPFGFIDYALVQWKGQESEYRSTLGLVKLIDLSSNRLVGSIPKAFSSVKGLISLNLSRNNLIGNMDPNIGDMEMLECLDLSRNQLSGEIPIGLAQLHYLAVLDLANNNLSGKIPTSTQLQSFNGSNYAGNSGLCVKPHYKKKGLIGHLKASYYDM